MGKLLRINIDVTKLDKSRFRTKDKDGVPYKSGAKFADLDVWIDDKPNQYNQDASVSESLTKEEREAEKGKNYIGNGNKVYGWGDPSGSDSNAPARQSEPEDDVPF